MRFKLHQLNFNPRARTPVGPMLLAAVCLALGISGLFAAKPRFSDLPEIFQPITNTSKVGIAGDTTAQPGVTNSLLQSGTNSISSNSTNSMEALDNTYRLAIGDRLSFRIVEDEEALRPLVVMDLGELEVPYIGRFPATGKTCKELAGALKSELEKEYYYQATVIVAVDLMRSRGKVYLVGPVRVPGPQEIPGDEVLTLSKAILRAGGLSDFADGRKVRVTRAGAGAEAREQIFTVDVEDVLKKGRIESDLPLQPGDLIYVPERLIRF